MDSPPDRDWPETPPPLEPLPAASAWANDGVDPQERRASALRQARWLIEFYRITPQDLVSPGDAALDNRGLQDEPPAIGAGLAGAESPVVKYRHPVTGQTWDGLGPHPQWLRQALLQEGYRVAEVRVDAHVDSVDF